MAVDAAGRRLLAAHSAAGTLTVVNLRTDKPVGEVNVGESSGVAVDRAEGKYFVGTTKGVAVVSSSTLKKTGFIDTGGPADAMVFDPANDRLYAGHDDGQEVWVIDASHDRVVGHISIPGAPELMAIDSRTDRLYLNIKPRNEVVAIDLKTQRIVNHWSTRPTVSPHGLVLDQSANKLFVAGHSRIVSEFTLDGKRVKKVDIGPGRVDQIAFDASLGRLYCPTEGRLAVVAVSASGTHYLGSVPIPRGTHSVAVDPKTHTVWIAYANGHHSYVQPFTPTSAAASGKQSGSVHAGD